MAGLAAISGWQQDMLRALDDSANTVARFAVIDTAAQALGFAHCALVVRRTLPITQPQIREFSSQPAAWQTRYAQAGFLDIDPAIGHGLRSESLVVWTDALYAQAPDVWREARDAGLRHCCTLSSLECVGVGSVLTLSRPESSLTQDELAHKAGRMRYLVQVAHAALGGSPAKPASVPAVTLTEREREVLRWTADGRTADEVAARCRVSTHTVQYHLRNCAGKLRAYSKASLVARALLLHLLD